MQEHNLQKEKIMTARERARNDNAPRVGYWVIKFDDQELRDLVFDDEKSARTSYKYHSDAWACHLYAPIEAYDLTAAALADERRRVWEEAAKFVGAMDKAMHPSDIADCLRAKAHTGQEG